MNFFGASEGESPRPWWRSRARHAALQRTEDRTDEPVRAVPGQTPDVRVPVRDYWPVRMFVAVVTDSPDEARDIIRAMGDRDRAVLSFHTGELSRLLSEEDMFRTDLDRRRARLSRQETDEQDD